MMSIRPSRFIKAATPTSPATPISEPSLVNSDTVQLSSEMNAFVRLFDTFTQKIYTEGYLMRQNNNSSSEEKPRTKVFAELSGSTLTLWDAEVVGSTVMPTYIQITDATTVQSISTKTEDGKRKKHSFSICFKDKKATSSVIFETSDNSTMVRWVTAIRLSCYEKQKLHQLFTLRLLQSPTSSVSSSSDSTVENKKNNYTYLQVRISGNTACSTWQKYWVVVDKKDERHSKRFGKKSLSSGDLLESTVRISLYETKKSKTPVLILNKITHAYAVYPESTQLIEKGSMIRIDCHVQGKQQEESHCWLMADNSRQTIQWLLSVYDAFKLYGRPECLSVNASQPQSLNFGEPVQDADAVHPRLFLEADEVIPTMDVEPIPNAQVEKIFIDALLKKTAADSHHEQQLSRRPTTSRANSLPLITVVEPRADSDEITNTSISSSPDTDSNNNKQDDFEDEPASFKFARQVADSSDESEDDYDEADEDEEEQDSDDEPIGKKNNSDKQSTQLDAPPKSLAESLIPDFDFGNGFDVPRNVTAAAVAAAVTASNATSPTYQSSGAENRTRHNSTVSMFLMDHDEEDVSNLSLHTRKVSMPAASRRDHQSADSPSSLFGDFSLATDFRKFSLPVQFSESNSIYDDRHSWDYEWQQQEDEEVERKNIGDDESYDSDFDGPLIPSLGDNFAPQNSLLDTYLGEQLSAKEQIEYARATGQPLIQVSTKKQGAPRGGLVGMISQRERDRKEGNGFRVAERVNQHNADRFEREKERRLLEQRQHQFLKHQVNTITE
jgi:hypothetical protein